MKKATAYLKKSVLLAMSFIFLFSALLPSASGLFAEETTSEEATIKVPLEETVIDDVLQETQTYEANNYVENQIMDVPSPETKMTMMTMAVLAQEPIQGQSTVAKQDIIDYLKTIIGASNYTTTYHEQVINSYYQIAPIYNIRPEVAIAQSMLETGYYKYTGLVKRDQYNFAGIYATGTAITAQQANNISNLYGADPTQVSLVEGEHGARFISIEAGIEGHIQHLYAYASTNPIPTGRKLIDPRYNLVVTGPNFGKAVYINTLTGWATDPNYGTKIATLLSNFPKTETEPLTQITNIKDGSYTISSVNSNLFLDIQNNSTANYEMVVQNTVSNSNSQIINFKSQGNGSYQLTFLHSNKSIDLSINKDVVQWETHIGENQRWFIYQNAAGDYFFKNMETGEYLQSSDNTVGKPLRVSATLDTNSNSQKFRIVEKTISQGDPTQVIDLPNGYYSITSKSNNLLLSTTDTAYKDYDIVRQTSSTPVVKTSQTIYFERQPDNSYVLTFYHSKKSLDLSATKDLVQWQTHKGSNQRWLLYKDIQGNYYLKNQLSNDYIGIKSNTANDVYQATNTLDTTSNNQKFTISQITKLPTSPYVTEIENGYYLIQNIYSQKYLEVYGGSRENGANIVQWSKNGYNNQVFEVINTSTGVKLINVESGKAVDTVNNQRGTQLIQWDSSEGSLQKFKIEKSTANNGSYIIVNYADKAFDAVSKDDGTRTISWDKHGASMQQYKFIKTDKLADYPEPKNAVTQVVDLPNGYYSITSKSNNLLLSTTDTAYKDYDIVRQTSSTPTVKTSQTIYFERQPDNSYVLTFYHSKKSLDLSATKDLVQWQTHKGSNQRWLLYKDIQGNYYLKNQLSNDYIGIKSNTANDVYQATNTLDTTSNNQKFTISQITKLPTSPYVTEIENGYYLIQNIYSQKYLEVYGGSRENGANIVQWSKNGYNNQVFEVINTSTGVKLINVESGKAVDTVNNQRGTQLIQWDSSEGSLQKFKIEKSTANNGSYIIVNYADKAFDAVSKDDGTRTISWDKHGASMQQYKFIKTDKLADYPRSPGIRGKVIFIDPGHGTYDAYYNGNFDPGAVKNGLVEASTNMQFANELVTKLKASGAIVYLSRDKDYTSANAPHISLYDRPRMANEVNADIFISIHSNSSTDTNIRGIETYHYIINDSRNVRSKYLATVVQNGMVSYSQSPDRGVRQADFCVIRETKMPAVLLEIGYLSNATDAGLIKNSGYRSSVTNGIVDGVNKYFNVYY